MSRIVALPFLGKKGFWPAEVWPEGLRGQYLTPNRAPFVGKCQRKCPEKCIEVLVVSVFGHLLLGAVASRVGFCF